MNRRTLLKRIGAASLIFPPAAGAAAAGDVDAEDCVYPSEDPDCLNCTYCPTKCCFCGPC